MAAADPVRPRPAGRRRRPSAWHLLLLPMSVVFAVPLVQMVFASLMPAQDIRRVPPLFLPRTVTLDGYATLFTEEPVLRWLLNTLVVTSISVAAHVVLCSLAGYGFARLRFRGRTTAFVLLVATIMIPIQLLMIPTFVLFTRLELINTLAAAFVPWLASAFGVFLMRQFFLSLPRELEEAALVDGCTPFTSFWRIVLPLARPALATLAVFTLIGSWNDLIWPLIAISDERLYTLQLGLANFQGTRRTQWDLLMAGNVVATLPLILGFTLAQRQFVATMTFSGLKG